MLGLAMTTHSDNIFVFEQFNDTYLTDGWQVTGSETGYWWISETNKAGGSPNEIEFYCNLSSTWRLVTPDDRGHGTHVAGTICGTGASGTQTGIAPSATIMALKAFNSEGFGEETHWVAAMQFALEHGVDLMNMSLGRPQPNAAQKLMVRQACDNTLAAGVVVAACAGNLRQMQFMVPPPNNIYTPGDCPPPYLHEDQLVNAGGLSCVISVGAVNYNNEIAPFSSEGPS